MSLHKKKCFHYYLMETIPCTSMCNKSSTVKVSDFNLYDPALFSGSVSMLRCQLTS